MAGTLRRSIIPLAVSGRERDVRCTERRLERKERRLGHMLGGNVGKPQCVGFGGGGVALIILQPIVI